MSSTDMFQRSSDYLNKGDEDAFAPDEGFSGSGTLSAYFPSATDFLVQEANTTPDDEQPDALDPYEGLDGPEDPDSPTLTDYQDMADAGSDLEIEGMVDPGEVLGDVAGGVQEAADTVIGIPGGFADAATDMAQDTVKTVAIWVGGFLIVLLVVKTAVEALFGGE